MIGDNHVQFGGGRSAERRSRPTLLFFMVENFNIFNLELSYFTYYSSPTRYNVEKVNIVNKIHDKNTLIIGDNNNDDGDFVGQNNNNSKHKYVKVLVNDPFNNRDIILKVTKKQKGVYV